MERKNKKWKEKENKKHPYKKGGGNRTDEKKNPSNY